MDDDDDFVPEEPDRMGPPARADLIRERHKALRERQRVALTRKLPPGVRIPPRTVKPLQEAPVVAERPAMNHTSPLSDTPPKQFEADYQAISESWRAIIVAMDVAQQDRGISDTLLARALDVDPSVLWRWRTGRLSPSAKKTKEIVAWTNGAPAVAQEEPLALCGRCQINRRDSKSFHFCKECQEALTARRNADEREIAPEPRPSGPALFIVEPPAEPPTHLAKVMDLLDDKGASDVFHASPLRIVEALNAIGATVAAQLILDQADELKTLREMRDNLRKFVTA